MSEGHLQSSNQSIISIIITMIMISINIITNNMFPHYHQITNNIFPILFAIFVLCFFICSGWSFVDAPLIFSCPADDVQYRIGNNRVYYWVWLGPDRLM